ncbi:conjugal transfer protein TraX [Streptococcus sanguinis]|uniref:TraX family protein n=1 Tax=Streptococcus sanguinis TaxID=1305 RepID=UPI002283D1CC|nr:TraX family protein [Streptococcus sanguinis]MCY7040335.1 conjugal transfer protein TraX [Streptococcus sanguinis]
MKKSLDAFHLKLIAIIAMFINHLGHTLQLENQNIYLYFLTETIGRLAFPIMAYLLVEGFQHTRSRGKYALRLTLFWLLSILPFYYLFESHKPLTVDNNILYTLLLGLLLLVFLEKLQHSFLRFVLILSFSFLTLQSDWGFLGILTIVGFYEKREQSDSFVSPILSLMIVSILINIWAFHEDPNPIILCDAVAMLGLLLTLPLLKAYNGQRGYSPAWVKWGFYAFYPLHLCLLLLFRIFFLKS